MKKLIALFLVLCMTLTAVSVFAESAPSTSSGLGDLLGGLLSSSGEGSGDGAGLGSLLGGLLSGSGDGAGEGSGKLSELLGGLLGGSGEGSGKISALIAGLKEQLKDPNGKLGSLVNALKSKLSSAGSADLGSLLGSLLGGSGSTKGTGGADAGELAALLGSLMGGSSTGAEGSEAADLAALLGSLSGSSDSTKAAEGAEGAEVPAEGSSEMTPEEQAELEAAFAELAAIFEKANNSEPRPVNKKEAAAIEDFYGEWVESKLYIGEEETDMATATSGLRVNENGAFFTENGEIDTSYNYPEKMVMKLENGELMVQDGEDWTAFTLTQDGELVLGAGLSIQIYYVPAAK